MSGGPFDSRKTTSQNASTQSTSVDTRNENVSGNSGVTAAATGGSSVDLSYAPVDLTTINNTDQSVHVTTDFGAVSAGISAAVSAAGLSANNSERAIAAVSANSANNADVLQSIAGHAIDTVEAISQGSANNSKELAAGYINSATGLFTQFGKTLADYQLAEQAQLGNTVSALNQSYREANTSSDERVQDIAKESTDLVREVFKYIAIAAGAGALLFLFKKGTRA
jgi:ElaB/YqjD/DUF883 family membrane-anchored ribosome-binding protein